MTADVQSFLPTIVCPTLVIWGLQARFVPRRHADILRARLPNCYVKFCDARGHLPQIEQQHALNEDAAAFLAEVRCD